MAEGYFSGTPNTEWVPAGDKADRKMRLLADFSFTDPSGNVWLVPAGYVIDGATIPRPLWSLVGSPYVGDYRRASVVHDKARADADDAAARRAADRMFYHACRAGGCSITQATLLYIAVRTGSWLRLVPGWRGISSSDDGPLLARSAVDERLEADFRLAAEQVVARGESDDPLEIEACTDECMSRVTGINLKGK
ncbi:MAG: DUF1353 domain-containing protein [Nitrosospira sp.]|nr:DUF1353 domain-containing protein [Nitrosospira sp.]